MEVLGVHLLLIGSFVLLAQGYIGYDQIPPLERLALRNFLLQNMYDTSELAGAPATRNDEAAPGTKPVIPLHTFVSGGTGEGKQHLGSDGKIPNKQVAIPEIQSGYDTPPNPCPLNTNVHDMEMMSSEKHHGMSCACMRGWDENEEDCSEASKCCLVGMPNRAEFVARYQEESKAADGFADPYGKNQYIGGSKRTNHVAKKSPPVYKRSASSLRRMPKQRRLNPYLNGQRIQSVVAKKAPALANHLEIM